MTTTTENPAAVQAEAERAHEDAACRLSAAVAHLQAVEDRRWRTEARTSQELSAHEDAALRCLSNGDREGARVQMRQWANLSADYDSARAEQAKAIRSAQRECDSASIAMEKAEAHRRLASRGWHDLRTYDEIWAAMETAKAEGIGLMVELDSGDAAMWGEDFDDLFDDLFPGEGVRIIDVLAVTEAEAGGPQGGCTCAECINPECSNNGEMFWDRPVWEGTRPTCPRCRREGRRMECQGCLDD